MNCPDKIGQYRVVCEVGNGSYFRLYRCVGLNDNRLFIKLINLSKLVSSQISPNSTMPIETEIRHNLNHANVLRLIDSGEVIIDGQRYYFLATEFAAGESLASKQSRDGRMSVYEVKNIITGVLNALKYLHSHSEPIIYNGIAPQNIFIDLSNPDLIAKLYDFGYARRLEKLSGRCYLGGLSPFYLAPEMFNGIFSTRTDLYAVGALMYHLIFGLEPWSINLSEDNWDKSVCAIIDARKAPLPIPDIEIFELDEQLLNVMAKALSQDVDQRFQSADEFLNAIQGSVKVENGNYTMIDSIGMSEEKSAEKTVPQPRGNGFADVAGLDALKQQLQEEVIDLLREPERYKRLRVKIPNGILLYGPPGCGKTFIAEKFAEELGCNFIKVDCADIASPYIHGGQGKISELFKEAEENAPSVLFLDEIDAMITDRSRHTNVSEQGEVNVFLTNLNNCSDRGIFVVAATNHPDMIDSAALRSGRLDIKIYVPMPDKEERKKILQLSLAGRCEPDIDYDQLAEKTEGYVSNDICQMVNKAALKTAKIGGIAIAMSVLLDTIEKGKQQWPSVSAKEVARQLKAKEAFETRRTNGRPHVGFK